MIPPGVQQSELLILVLALALAPLAAWAYRSIELRDKIWLALALNSMVGAYVATVVEGFFAPEVFNVIEHGLFATAGICFFVVSLDLLGSTRRERSLEK